MKCGDCSNVIIKPDGINELDPCFYEVVEAYENVSIEILKCKKCGHTTISWKRQENTNEIQNI